MANRYPFNIEWSEEDQEYIATCPAFPSLSAFGETEEEALKEGKIALAGFIETCEANNLPLPEPVVHESASGKFQLRLPKSLPRLAARMANLEGVSLNSYIADAVRAKVSGDQLGNRVIGEIRQLLVRTQTAAAAVITAEGRPLKYTERTSTQTLSEKTVLVATESIHRRGN
jgi:predicted RNase H-like HicB family nuclease